MKANYLTIALIFVASGIYAQSNIHESGGNVGIGTNFPLEKLTIANEHPNALGIYRDLDVGTVGPAGIFFNFGAKSGSQFTSGAQITGVLDNPANTGWMTFSTLNAGSLSEKMRITKEGNVGIGTSSPGNYKLNVMGVISGGVNNYSYNAAVPQLTNESKVDGISGVSPTGAFRWYTNPNNSYASGFLYQLRAYDVVGGETGDLLVINGSGNVGIGTSNVNSFKLAVNGKVRAHEIKVETANWPDYVFAKDYQLSTLQETEKHIKDKGHLPGIPSAAEVKANGLDLGEMNAKLLQKIEELTLHLIEQNKRNTENQKQIDKRLEELRNENEHLKVAQEMMDKELKKLKQ